MALKNCPNCGHSVSEMAAKCPKCDAVINKQVYKETRKMSKVAVLLSVVAVIVAAVLIVGGVLVHTGVIECPVNAPAGIQSRMGNQEAAVDTAKSYLTASAFSYDGLVKQLEYLEFSKEDAIYAAEHCGADWNEQAVRSAQEYLATKSNWTREELLAQLRYNGFTEEQALYGVNQCGL